MVAADRDGQLVISDAVTSLTITVDLWDARGNRATSQHTLNRPVPPLQTTRPAQGEPVHTDH